MSKNTKENYDIAIRPLTDDKDWLDDIVFIDCNIHLEQMDANDWMLICYPKKGGKIVFSIHPEREGLRVVHNYSEEMPKDLIYEKGSITL